MTNTNKVNILLVDDQPGKLLTYEAILRDLGENLLTASSATEALDCLLRNEIGVILVDVCMPDFDGYELASMIREHPRYQKTSIIFVSAILMTDLDRLRGYECGAVDYVPVPVVPEILRAKVSVFADLYRKTRQLEQLNLELENRVSERTAALEASTAALQEADRRKDEFLAMLAHELRNPLAPIRTAVQLMRMKELAAAQSSRLRDVIERQVEHLVRLIDDLLDVSRITRGMITLQREPIELSAVIARAVETARPLIDSRRHELTVQLAEEGIIVDGDPTRLTQVVGNLLNNAAKFTDERGRILLTLAREDQEAVITIRDSGVGIAVDLLPSIFDMFTQVHHGVDRSLGGLGIGLALVRRLVEMHGGRVTAESRGADQGSEFTVRLPIHAARLSADQGPVTGDAEPFQTVSPQRVLVVDDNVDAAESVAALLRLAGHDVRVAYDGLEALAAGDVFAPDVVLLDLGMPRLNGFDTATRIRRKPWGSQARLVALTGWGQQQDRHRTTEAGFDAHLVKPVSQADLFRTLSGCTAEGLSQSALAG
jgi:signal transduction histidine kinase